MPNYAIEVTIRASTRFTLHIEADGEAEARDWTRELLIPAGLNVGDDVYEDTIGVDEGDVDIRSLEGSAIPSVDRIVTAGFTGRGSWSRADG